MTRGMRWLTRVIALGALVAAPLACTDIGFGTNDPTGPGSAGTTATSGGGGNGGSASDIVGSWSRADTTSTVPDLVVVTTTWTFNADGTAARVITTTDMNTGTTSTTTDTATWTLSGNTLTVVYQGTGPAGSGTATFQEAVSGGTLTLDGTTYTHSG
jgi:hypothetical protein